jgi:general secretion pathway protein D
MYTAQYSSSSRQTLLRSAAAIVVAFVLLCVPPPLRAQNGDTVTMNMRDADIRGLIQWIADQTGKNMVVHKDVAGKVTVLSAKPVSREEAYRVFLSVLQVHGYAAIETPEAVKIVPVAIASQSGVPYSGSPTSDMVVQVFKATNVGATELAQMLKPLVSKDAVINADAGTNLLLIADHAANVAGLQQLVQKMDRSGGSEVELVRLEHANAREVVASLTALFPTQASTGMGGPEGAGGTAALAVNFSADERSNSVLLSGDTVKRNQIRRLIRQMDTPLTGTGNTRVVYLQYADAKELVPILKSLSQSVLKDQKDKETSFSIEASETANALVINAPAGLIDTLRDVVTRLDIRRAQVLVEALVVEVSNDVSDDLGVTWLTTNAEDANDSAGFAGVNTLGDLDLGSVVRDEDTGEIVGVTPGRGITFGYFENGNLQAAIRALRATTKANILSTPTVVAIDNEPASLLVGQNVPFITGQSTGAAASTENPFTTIERKDIGISLEITPRINRGDAITLEIKQKVENIAPSVENASDLITNKREIITKALIKDDQVLVLGGLISDDESEIREKVPILGDLPLIGRLFSGTGKTRRKTNLMVFIHPMILKDEEHVSEVSQARYDFMREQQRRAREEPPPSTERHPAEPAVMEEFEVFSPVNRLTPR